MRNKSNCKFRFLFLFPVWMLAAVVWDDRWSGGEPRWDIFGTPFELRRWGGIIWIAAMCVKMLKKEGNKKRKKMRQTWELSQEINMIFTESKSLNRGDGSWLALVRADITAANFHSPPEFCHCHTKLKTTLSQLPNCSSTTKIYTKYPPTIDAIVATAFAVVSLCS